MDHKFYCPFSGPTDETYENGNLVKTLVREYKADFSES